MGVKYFFFILLLISANRVFTQPIRDINYSHLYSPTHSITFDLKAIRSTANWVIFYKLQLRDTTVSMDDLTIQWETRNDVNEKEGVSISEMELGLTIISPQKTKQYGKVNVNLSENLKIIVAKVYNRTLKKSAIFFKILEPNYPFTSYLTDEHEEVIFDPYILAGENVSINGFTVKRLLTVSYYKGDFPVAAPVFSESQASVSKTMRPDSTFRITSSSPVSFQKKGLYLVQEDVDAAEGLAFRVEEDYPKVRKFQSLLDPFIYVSTKQEFARLKQAGIDKKKFDKVVLDITNDVDRAKDFMRVYFNRVEAANEYFTSYKEGWKTDRGMIYMIYGQPKSVYKLLDREVWTYDKVTFNFMKSNTLFDPDNYVLMRNTKYSSQWFEKVDLVRNSRF